MKQRFLTDWYCWWFRYPAPSGMYKTLLKMRYSSYQLVSRISAINSMCHLCTWGYLSTPLPGCWCGTPHWDPDSLQEPEGQLSVDKVDVLYQTNYLQIGLQEFQGKSRESTVGSWWFEHVFFGWKLSPERGRWCQIDLYFSDENHQP